MGFTSITNVVFTDGYLQNFSFLDTKSRLASEYIENGLNKTKFGFISFLLTEKQASAVASYIDEYKSKAAEKNYGFPVDPLRFEGGGCTSFANAIITKAMVGYPIRYFYNRSVYIPHQLMGYDQALLNRTENVEYDGPGLPEMKVNILKTLEYKEWANASNGYPFMFYDPELFYLSSSFARNRLLANTGKDPVHIHDIVKGDASVPLLKREVEKYVDGLSGASIVTLYGVQGVLVARESS